MARVIFVFFAFVSCLVLSVHGAFVHFDLTLSWKSRAPNGQARDMILINDQFPGPPLLINEGDTVRAVVTNEMPFNMTIHWHGLEMMNTPWVDGVPGLSQKPIEPGSSYVYQWTATQYGTYWYHAHSRGALQDGLYGAIHIQPKPGSPSPFHLISRDPSDVAAMASAASNPNLVLLSDWDQYNSTAYMEAQRITGLDIFCMDSLLVNGMGAVHCPGLPFLQSLMSPALIQNLGGQPITNKGCLPNIELTQGEFPTNSSGLYPGLEFGCDATTGQTSVIEVDARTQWASLNFISGTSLKEVTVSIDNHELWIYEVDGRYIYPQRAQAVGLFNGERYSALVRLDKTPGRYTIRVADSGGLDQIISGFAALQYQGGHYEDPYGPYANYTSVNQSSPQGTPETWIPYINYAGVNTSESTVMFNSSSSLLPYPPIKPAPVADETFVLQMGRLGASWQWTLDGKELYQQDRSAYDPLLYNLNGPDAQDKDLTIRTQNGSWVDIVLQVGAFSYQPIEFPHSIHKHSNKAWIVGAGNGIFNYATTAEAMAADPSNFNLENPPYKDTFVTGGNGPSWIVIRYQSVNPGAWLIHCHVETHLEGGMAVAILDGVDKWPTVPREYAFQDGEPAGHPGAADSSTVGTCQAKR